jgi:hypothetical protein
MAAQAAAVEQGRPVTTSVAVKPASDVQYLRIELCTRQDYSTPFQSRVVVLAA